MTSCSLQNTKLLQTEGVDRSIKLVLQEVIQSADLWMLPVHYSDLRRVYVHTFVYFIREGP